MADIQSYLTFRLNDELFATSVSRVLEIVEIPRITRVPRSPENMRGVINLRGSMLPVLDARAVFSLPPVEDTLMSRIIVMDLNITGQDVIIGLVVDAVHEVTEIASSEIQPPPGIGSKYKAEFMQGMVRMNEQFIMVLDFNLILSSSEAILLQEVIENAEPQVEENS
jgi:purine-binding chemotaxis protein CheW